MVIGVLVREGHDTRALTGHSGRPNLCLTVVASFARLPWLLSYE